MEAGIAEGATGIGMGTAISERSCVEGTLRCAEGQDLFVRSWEPHGAARARVVIVHGIAEHGGRYAHVGEHLAAHGYAAHAVDLRGHGRSKGSPVYVDSFDEYLDDVTQLLTAPQYAGPGLPTVLLGHSMGGTIAALLAIERDLSIDGIILSAPAVRLGGDVPPWLVRISQLLGRYFPRMGLIPVPFGGLCRDPEVVARHQADPLVYRDRVRARPGAELTRAAETVQARMEELELSLLILHGTADRLVDVAGSKELYARAKAADKTLKLYDGLFHEVMNEPEKESVLADIVEWLDARTDNPAVNESETDCG